jgi:hypothetical protein
MRYIILAAALALAGCANTGVLQNGSTLVVKTRVSLGAGPAALDEAVKTAMEHCAIEDKQLFIKQRFTNECALRGGCGEAQLYFVCKEQGNVVQERSPNYVLEVRQR